MGNHPIGRGKTDLLTFWQSIKTAEMQLGTDGARRVSYSQRDHPQESLNKKIGQFVKLIQKNPDYDHDTAWKILKKLASLKKETGVAKGQKINIFTFALHFIRSLPTFFYRREAKLNTLGQNIRESHIKKVTFASEAYQKCAQHVKAKHPSINIEKNFHGKIDVIQSLLLQLILIKKPRPSVGLFIDDKNILCLYEKNAGGKTDKYEFGRIELPSVTTIRTIRKKKFHK